MLSLSEKKQLRKRISLDSSRATQVFDALGDANRCNLFRVLIKKDSLNVTDAASILDISVPLVSQHLKILESNKLLLREKRGREVFYSVNLKDPLVKAISKVVA
jgi:ArsR family transcriptional regulator